jgi:hypothetical protein
MEGLNNGIPIQFCKTNKALVEYLITYMGLSEGEVYAVHSWREAKTKTHTALTKPLMIIEVLNVEKMAFKVSKDGRMNRYWFRKTDKPIGARQ